MDSISSSGLAGSSGLPKSANLLADALRREILVARLPPGESLPGEADLMSQTGFSRGVVRESLRLLEAEGLIAVRRGRKGGVTVTAPDITAVTKSLALQVALSETPLGEFFVFRKLLEPAAARIAAENATSSQRDELLVAAQITPSDAVEHNVNFHIIVADATNNEFFRVVLHAVHTLTLWHSLEGDLEPENLNAAAHGHRRIARHIVDAQPEKAERAMHRHIDAFQRIMQQAGRLDAAVIPPSRWDLNSGKTGQIRVHF